MCQALICIVKTRKQAEAIVAELAEASIATNDISVLLPRQTATLPPVAGDASASLARNSSLVGSVFGLLAGIGILVIPGAGPHLAAGPIIAALSGGAMGFAMGGGTAIGLGTAIRGDGAIGGIAGGLIWMGMSERRARHYELLLRQGNVLVSVLTQHNNDLRRARTILTSARANDIAVVGKPAPAAFAAFYGIATAGAQRATC